MEDVVKEGEVVGEENINVSKIHQNPDNIMLILLFKQCQFSSDSLPVRS
jgi:hypothetical protein